KPANLLLDSGGRLWVTDFGLAQVRHGEASLTMTGDLVGTLRYMSPEQALAKRVVIDHRTDIYSLGVTLYELLAGQPAVRGQTREEILRQIVFGEPKPLRQWDRAIPRDLETIILKAMAQEPERRYATAQELADDLRHWLEDRPIRARRPPLRARLARWGRRHPPLVAAATAVVILAALMLAGSIGWAANERATGREATSQQGHKAPQQAADRQRRLPEALSAARRVVGIVSGGEADEALRRDTAARLADLELLDRLESVRVEKETAVKDGRFDETASIALYGQILQAADLGVE